uniref:F-box domain-containing protein n=1 Tax=Mimiviridae sp. ChoanoV1 TaxID=2596887 RepID=A0A5B8HV97_9VIRU|nr:hypothetical protein 2_21 [Mimiviridae sp. ChoanoV1]
MNLSLLPYDIIIKIFGNLDITEAKNLGNSCKHLNYIFQELSKKNKYQPLNDSKLIKNYVNKGIRFLKINNDYYKIINIIQYINDSITIIFKNGDMLNINKDNSLLFNLNKKRIYIQKNNIKIILKSKFKYKINSISWKKYIMFN